MIWMKERSFSFRLRDSRSHLVYENKEHKEYGAYRPGTIRIDGELWDYSGGEKETRSVCIDRERLKQLDFDVTHEILVELV